MTYLDIETISKFPDFDSADERTKELFEQKMKMEPTLQSATTGRTINMLVDPIVENMSDYDNQLRRLYQEKAALFAEFNKVVCVSFGWVVDYGADFKAEDPEVTPRCHLEFKSFYQLDEYALLRAVGEFINDQAQLCAHFGKGFDYPILSRKFVMHGLPLPYSLNNSGRKPWEIPLIDTAEMWKFGDLRHTCSLDLLAFSLGLPSPKKVMHGADVSRVYHTEGIEGLKKIVEYCEQGDVRTLINVHRKMTGLPAIL